MSQFIEEFGGSKSTKPLTDFIDVSFPGEWGQEDKNGDGVKVIRTTNFTNIGKLDLTDVVTRDIDAAKVEKKKLKKGDILLERSGGTNDNPVGRVVYFDEEGTFLFNNFTQLLRCKEGVNPTFLFYSLFNYYWMNKRAIRGMGNKTTGIQNLKMDKYWQIPIADVPIECQEEFESIYNQADKSEFVGSKSQFIEMFGDDTTRKSLCEICRPKQWPTIQTKDFTEDGYLVYGANGVIGHYKEYNHKYPTILMACRGASCGAINVSEPESYITGNAMCLDDLSNEVCFEFLVHFLTYYDYKTIITGGAQPQITITSLQKIEIPIPPKKEQEKFVAIARQADKSEYELRTTIDEIDAFIQWLTIKIYDNESRVTGFVA